MKKKLFFFSTIILTLAGCTSEDFVGDEELKWENENGKAISLNLVAAPQTRAPQTGATAAATLNNNFVVYGWKSFTSGTPATQVVFNNYQANYVTGSNNTTTSNSAGWEYVGYTNVPNGVTTSVGVTAFSALTGSGGANASGVEQSIKYWDYSADKYEFFGYSLGGTSSTTSWATSTAMSPYTFDLEGTQAQLSACYISDLLTKVDQDATHTSVQLQFRKMESKVRIALYETIPGYSVKDVKFYPTEGGTSSTTAYLYDKSALTSSTATASLPSKGKFTVTYTPLSSTPSTSQQTPANITWTPAETAGSTSSVSFGIANPGDASDQWTGWKETTTERVVDNGVLTSLGAVYLGWTSSGSTKSPEVSVLPNPSGSDLYLKVDYTLVALDGYGETINVTGATATVPSEFTQWQPNCSYTYVFKISDNTNGAIGAITGLHPITLDAVVNTNAEGTQETITTVSNPSITTYQKGSDVLTDNEYKAGTIYVIVGDGTTTPTEGTNANLYTASVTLADPTTDVANITEASVANAIANPTGAKDANGNLLTVTLVDSGLTSFDTIPAADAPHGVNLTINGAKFTATAGTTYVFEYIVGSDKYYKVIKVASGS